MGEKTRPHCGAPVTAARDAAGIFTVACSACSAMWSRQAPRCRVCAGEDVVECEQHLTVTPRGTLRSTIAARSIRLCPRCDSEEIAYARARGMLIHDEYRPRFVHGDPEARPVPAKPQRTREPSREPRTTPAAPSLVPTAPAKTEPPRPRITDPTVRQAISLFLEQARTAATAMLLLGQHRRPGTRLSALDSYELVEGWLSLTYAVDSSGYATVHCALEYWRRQGWLPED